MRFVNITIQLSTDYDVETQVHCYDRKTLRVRHASQTTAIPLPASVDITSTVKVKIAESKREISLRLPASPIKRSDENQVPASDPSNTAKVNCTGCNSLLVNAVSWKRLPTQYWAELLDSWHCHKGVDNSHIHDQFALPDYLVAAADRIRAKTGTGLVGVSHLVVSQEDLIGADISVSMLRASSLGMVERSLFRRRDKKKVHRVFRLWWC